jgi:hypothetical protein
MEDWEGNTLSESWNSDTIHRNKVGHYQFLLIQPHTFHNNFTICQSKLNNIYSWYILIYLQSWALIEKPPIVQLPKNFSKFYETRSFITVFTRALHWSLSWARWLQSIPSHLISLRSKLILSTHLHYSDWVRAGRPRGRSLSPGRVKNFLFCTSSRPALGSIQPPIEWVSGALSPGVKGPGVKLTTHLQKMPRSRKMWLYTSTPPYAFMA